MTMDKRLLYGYRFTITISKLLIDVQDQYKTQHQNHQYKSPASPTSRKLRESIHKWRITRALPAPNKTQSKFSRTQTSRAQTLKPSNSRTRTRTARNAVRAPAHRQVNFVEALYRERSHASTREYLRQQQWQLRQRSCPRWTKSSSRA